MTAFTIGVSLHAQQAAQWTQDRCPGAGSLSHERGELFGSLGQMSGASNSEDEVSHPGPRSPLSVPDASLPLMLSAVEPIEFVPCVSSKQTVVKWGASTGCGELLRATMALYSGESVQLRAWEALRVKCGILVDSLAAMQEHPTL